MKKRKMNKEKLKNVEKIFFEDVRAGAMRNNLISKISQLTADDVPPARSPSFGDCTGTFDIISDRTITKKKLSSH